MEVGSTVLWNDTGLLTQYSHSAGDGRTVRLVEQRQDLIPRRC
jgi:hypothetical protein